MPHPNSEVGGSRRAGQSAQVWGPSLQRVAKEDFGKHSDNEPVHMFSFILSVNIYLQCVDDV